MYSQNEKQMELQAAQNLAYALMRQHGLIPGWSFEFDNSLNRFGVCKYRPKVISLSRNLVKLNGEPEVRDTILHEIAHALTPGDHHGRAWKLMCIRIGAKPERCFKREDKEAPAGRYQAVCGGCGTVHHRHKKPQAIEGRKVSCRCQSNVPWAVRHLLVYKDTAILRY